MYSWVDLISCIQNMRPHTDWVCVLVFAPVSRNHNFDIPVRIVTRLACAEGSSEKFQHFSSIIYGIQLSFTVTNLLAHLDTHTQRIVCVYGLICLTDSPNIMR